MPDLSACYFCGAAADAQVREYDVVPDDSLRSTATLCPGCREKLETVLSPVVRGAQPSDEPVDVRLDAIEAGDADDEASTPTLEVESEDILAAADRSRDVADAAPTSSEGSSASGDGDAPAASSDADDETASTDGTDADPLAGSAGDSATDGIAFGDESDASASSGADADPESEPTGEESTASGSDAASASASTGGAGSDVERPDADTYNRVVRLLQNREFPVNRSEFSDLASSAYDVPGDECAQVIDYAIQRGELVEESGMLKKP